MFVIFEGRSAEIYRETLRSLLYNSPLGSKPQHFKRTNKDEVYFQAYHFNFLLIFYYYRCFEEVYLLAHICLGSWQKP